MNVICPNFHAIYSTEYLIAQGLAKHWSVVSNCIVYDLYFLSFIPLSLFNYYYYYTDGSSNSSNIFYFVSVIKLFLSQPMSFNFFSDPPPHCEGVNGMHIFIPEHIKEVTDYFCMIADQITNRTSGLKLQSKSNYYTFT